MLTPDPKTLLSICSNYAGHDYHVGDLIPEGKLRNFRKAQGSIADDTSVLALLDSTLFGSNKEGIAICTNGVFWNTDSSTPHKGMAGWDEIARGPLTRIGYHEVQIGRGKRISLTGCDFPVDTFAWLLIDIQTMLLRSSPGDPGLPLHDTPPPLHTETAETWKLAIGGRQSGSYTLETIRSLIEAEHVDPAQAQVWKAGMADWIPLLSLPQFSGTAIGRLVCSSCGYENDPIDRYCGGCGHVLAKIHAGDPEAAHAAPLVPPPPPKQPRIEPRRIDLNSAPPEALLDLPGITLTSAHALVEERVRRGGFSSVDEAGEILHLQPHQLEWLRSRVVVRPHASASLVDLNTAPELELAKLPGIGPVLAKKAVSIRARQGHFHSVDDFVSELSLPDHVRQRLREVATATAPEVPSTPAPGRRVVDY